ncbi:MAG: DUF669 domain-containing protein [Opitutaceae bacterium]|jgi:Protein of unknown function (DUF669)
MSKFGFDLNDYAVEDRNFEPLPKGDYELKCTEAEEKTTQKGGQMIAATFEVVSGKAAGRKIWNNFNIHNDSEKAQKIGREQVSAWARACGKPNANSFDELLERQFTAVLDIEKGTNGYSDRNRIVGYASKAETAPKPPAKKDAIADLEEDIPKNTPKEGKKKNPWD